MSCWARLSDQEKQTCFDSTARRVKVFTTGIFTKLRAWEIRGPLLDEWKVVLPKLNKLVKEQEIRDQLFLKKSHLSSSVLTFTLYLLGRKPRCDRLNPTIVFYHNDIDIAKRASSLFQKLQDGALSTLLQGYHFFHDQFDVELCADVAAPMNSIQHAEKLSLCGAKIVIQATSGQRAHHVEPGRPHEALMSHATIGGILLLGDIYYALTTAHAFRKLMEEEPSFQYQQFSIHLDPDTLPDGAEQYDRIICKGEKPTTLTSEEHRGSILMGEHVDWALIPIHNSLFITPNLIELAGGEKLHIEDYVKDEPSGPLLVLSGSSKSSLAELIKAPSGMILPYSQQLTLAWVVKRGSDVGDCGSWVLDGDGHVFAMVVASSKSENLTFCLPISEIIEDIKARFSLAGIQYGEVLKIQTEAKSRALTRLNIARPFELPTNDVYVGISEESSSEVENEKTVEADGGHTPTRAESSSERTVAQPEQVQEGINQPTVPESATPTPQTKSVDEIHQTDTSDNAQTENAQPKDLKTTAPISAGADRTGMEDNVATKVTTQIVSESEQTKLQANKSSIEQGDQQEEWIEISTNETDARRFERRPGKTIFPSSLSFLAKTLDRLGYAHTKDEKSGNIVLSKGLHFEEVKYILSKSPELSKPGSQKRPIRIRENYTLNREKDAENVDLDLHYSANFIPPVGEPPAVPAAESKKSATKAQQTSRSSTVKPDTAPAPAANVRKGHSGGYKPATVRSTTVHGGEKDDSSEITASTESNLPAGVSGKERLHIRSESRVKRLQIDTEALDQLGYVWTIDGFKPDYIRVQGRLTDEQWVELHIRSEALRKEREKRPLYGSRSRRRGTFDDDEFYGAGNRYSSSAARPRSGDRPLEDIANDFDDIDVETVSLSLDHEINWGSEREILRKFDQFNADFETAVRDLMWEEDVPIEFCREILDQHAAKENDIRRFRERQARHAEKK